jgi:AraC-like DNA-binding protein
VVTQRSGSHADLDSARTTLGLRIRQVINEHLAEPDLCPETIAAAQHISVRYLHKIFHDQGTAVTKHSTVAARRMPRELEIHSSPRPTVAAIAHRRGFATPAHFSLLFRNTYGTAPSHWHGETP